MSPALAQINNNRVLVTGSAGFIGFHLSKILLSEGFIVHGYDGVTDYYDVGLKKGPKNPQKGIKKDRNPLKRHQKG